MGEHPRIGYVIGTYPLLTTRFVDREIRAMRDLDVEVEIVSLRRPSGDLSDDQRDLATDVSYVMPASVSLLLAAAVHYAWRPSFLRLASSLLTASHPSLRARLKTVMHLGQGLATTRLFADSGITNVHAHFVDRAAVVAMVVSDLLAVPYSATAHANDIYVDPVLLDEKIRRARFVSTCTEFNSGYLMKQFGDAATDKVKVDYHGLDVGRYMTVESKDGPTSKILAIGQLKEKKGFSYLIDAVKILRDHHDFDVVLEIVGAGPLEQSFRDQISTNGLDEIVTLTGSLPHPSVVARLGSASVFVMSSVLASNGDRDGIPNVILEAMASGVPVVATSVSGIPEVVHDEKTGLLVTPNSSEALAEAIHRLLADPELRHQLAENAREFVAERFDTETNARRLLGRFVDQDVA